MPVHTFPVRRPVDLVVRTAHGSVSVEAREGLREATVSIEPCDPSAADLVAQTVVELRGSALVVHAPRQGGIFDLPFLGGRRADKGLDIRVTVPTGSDVKVSSFTAGVDTTGRLGRVDIAFATADVALDEVGDLRLRFGSGTVKAGHVHGRATVKSGAGDAQFGEVDGDLNCGCGSGTIRVGVARGQVHARTGSGSAELEAVHGDVNLVSGSGPMSIGLPAGVTARLDVATGSGQVRSELPISERPAGTGGSITVRARTGSGDVRLFRAA